jgi:uncharacterized protein with GYD domain
MATPSEGLAAIVSEGEHSVRVVTAWSEVDHVDGGTVPKFLIEASYESQGANGLAKEGGSSRRAFVGDLIKKHGGTMECFYYAFGAADVYAIFDMPDTTSALAMSLAINASGAVKLTTTPLISVEEVDAAAKMQVGYRAPGAS